MSAGKPVILDLDAAPDGAGLLDAFDRLPVGGALIIVGERRRCAAQLPLLQNARPGAFEWSPLAPQGGYGRVQIHRRDPAVPRGINEALAWDHDRLEVIEAEAFAARAAGDYTLAAARYGDFAAGLRRHIGFEEKVLFPEFSSISGMPADAGPVAVMCEEHREIEQYVARILAAIGDPERDPEPDRRQLHYVLGEHNLKEEEMLYPATDEGLAPKARAELVQRIQQFAE